VPLTSFFGRHPLLALLTLSLLICGSAAVANTNIHWGMSDQVSAGPNNPHYIPDHMDPKSSSLAEEIRLIKVEIAEEVVEVSDTVHSIAFRDQRSQAQPTYDYTTGTSN
jgi:hypothetical protein